MCGSAGRGDRWAVELERRLAIPVVVAALASVPAVFLTTLDGAAGTAGRIANWASLGVLTGESVILLLLSSDRWRWVRTHKWPVLVALLAIPAVVFAVGPAQVLRLVQTVGALRLIRAGRILRAGRVLRERWDLRGPWRIGLLVGATVLAASFVAIILADPTSQSRELARDLVERVGIAPLIVAGVILAAATIVVVRYRRR